MLAFQDQREEEEEEEKKRTLDSIELKKSVKTLFRCLFLQANNFASSLSIFIIEFELLLMAIEK